MALEDLSHGTDSGPLLLGTVLLQVNSYLAGSPPAVLVSKLHNGVLQSFRDGLGVMLGGSRVILQSFYPLHFIALELFVSRYSTDPVLAAQHG